MGGGAMTGTAAHLRVLEVAKPDCVTEDLHGEIVVLNLVSGVYFSLRNLAAAVWRDLAAGHSVGSLISGISRVDERIAVATAELIDKFEQTGIMRQASPRPVETEPESLASVRTGEVRLTFESFDDMKELVLSSPVHISDIDDQMGWQDAART
jgi:hypothetical protein